MADFMKIGEQLAASGFFGEIFPAQGFAIASGCYQEGLSYEQWRRTYHVIEGKPSMRADTMLAKLLEQGGNYEILERTDLVAHIRANRAGCEPHEVRFTMEDAIAVGLPFKNGTKTLKRNWRVHPKNMLWARASSDAVRAVDPRVNHGIYTPEEMESPNGDDIANAISGDPVPLTKAPAAVPEDPFTAIPKHTVDYDIVPFGPHAGKTWLNLGRDILQLVIANPKTLTKEHIEAAQVALDKSPF